MVVDKRRSTTSTSMEQVIAINDKTELKQAFEEGEWAIRVLI